MRSGVGFLLRLLAPLLPSLCAVKLGRKPKPTEHQKHEAIRRRDRDREPVGEIARSYLVDT